MHRIGFAAMICALLYARAANADLEPKSRNTVLFVESAQKGHEWEAYRLAEDRRPVIFEVEGPGRVLLTLRTFAEPEGSEAIGVVLLDERIILTAKVDPKVDEGAKFPDAEKRVPSKVRFYLVRIPLGAHQVTVRYSGGAPTLVAARFSKTDTSGEGDPTLVTPKPHEGSVPKIGKLRARDELEAEPGEEQAEEAAPRTWRETLADPDPPLEPRVGPLPHAPGIDRSEVESDREQPERTTSGDARVLMIPAPWLTFEVRAGAQLNRLGLSVAPAVGVEGRIPVPGLDARSFSIGLAAEVAHTEGESALKSGNATVGVAEVRHTVFGASADLRWVFLNDVVDPYLSIGAGALFGSMSTSVDEQRIARGTTGGFGLLVAGAALGGLGHRPYLEARLQAGLLSSEMLATGETAYVTGSLMIGFRFEFLREVAAQP